MSVYKDTFLGLTENDREKLSAVFDKARAIGDICTRANLCRCIDAQELAALDILSGEIDSLLSALKEALS